MPLWSFFNSFFGHTGSFGEDLLLTQDLPDICNPNSTTSCLQLSYFEAIIGASENDTDTVQPYGLPVTKSTHPGDLPDFNFTFYTFSTHGQLLQSQQAPSPSPVTPAARTAARTAALRSPLPVTLRNRRPEGPGRGSRVWASLSALGPAPAAPAAPARDAAPSPRPRRWSPGPRDGAEPTSR